MARTRATIHCSIHANAEWLERSPEAKLTYLTLLSQPTITMAGCIEYNPAKWARLTGLDIDIIDRALTELRDAGFVDIDHDTYELVVRTFTRWDISATNNPRIGKAVRSALDAIMSPRLRQVVIDAMPDDLAASAGVSPGRSVERSPERSVERQPKTGTARGDAHDPDGYVTGDMSPSTDENRESDSVSEKPRSQIRASTERSPERSTERSDTRSYLSPPPSPSPPPKTLARRSPPGTLAVAAPGSPPPVAESEPNSRKPTLDDHWRRWWDTCPRKVGKQAARRAWDRARKQRTPAELQAALEACLPAWQTMDERFIPHPATWLGQGRYDDPPPQPQPQAQRPAANVSKPAANIARIDAALARMQTP